MTRWSSVLRSDVVARMKSSPWRTNSVATTPVASVNRSTWVKSRFIVCSPKRSAGTSTSPMGALAAVSTDTSPDGSAARKLLAIRWVVSVRVLSYSAMDCCITCAATSRSARARCSMARPDCRCTTMARRVSTMATATVTWRESLLPRERRESRVMGQED